MEEHIGQAWHRLIRRAARQDYPQASVHLNDVRKQAGIVFRALGGDGGLKLEACSETAHGARRSIAQRLAGTGSHVELAWRDEETLRLPMQMALFDRASLNRDLYLWLAALAAVSGAGDADWLRRNASASGRVLSRYPGMRQRYERLMTAHVAQRPRPDTLRADEAAREERIQYALIFPDAFHEPLPPARQPSLPVPLWLHPTPPILGCEPAQSRKDDEEEQDNSAAEKSQRLESKKRRRGERVDTPDGRDGLLAFRLESLFSRAEYVAVDRSTEEDQDEDAGDAMEDLDLLSMASGGKRPKSRLRFDLDLPSEEHDDIPLGEGILLPEWDFRQQRLLPDHCCLQPLLGKESEPAPLPARLCGKSRRMRQVFELVQARRTWRRGQLEGSEIDTDALIEKACDKRRGVDSGELRLFRELRTRQRDLSCLLLADLSLSTDTWIDNEQRVIDVIRDSVLLFCEALAATNDQFALYGFSSRRRNHVRFHTLKTFDEQHSEATIGRILQIRPGYYTRMGAALRYATQLLQKTPASQKLLILLTDGKPNDLDKYEGRYGVEDTRQAVLEASHAGVTPFCVTIDDKAQAYLPYIFGQSSFVRVKQVSDLPSHLPRLYASLTRR